MLAFRIAGVRFIRSAVGSLSGGARVASRAVRCRDVWVGARIVTAAALGGDRRRRIAGIRRGSLYAPPGRGRTRPPFDRGFSGVKRAHLAGNGKARRVVLGWTDTLAAAPFVGGLTRHGAGWDGVRLADRHCRSGTLALARRS